MAKLEIYPVYSYLSDATPLEMKYVDDILAIPIPGLQFQPRMRMLIKQGRYDGKYHFFRLDTGRLPTGLIPKAIVVLKDVEIVDHSMEGLEEAWEKAKAAVDTVQLNGIELTKVQREAIKSAVYHRRGIIKAATGAGKSEIAAAIAKCFNLPALVLTHRTDLLHQTAERIEQRTGLPVGRIGDGKSTIGHIVTVAMMQSIDTSKRGKAFLDRFKVFMGDEGHHLCATTQQNIAALINTPFRYALSGSFPVEKLKLYKIMAATDATLLFEVTNKTLIETGWSASPKILVRKLNFGNLEAMDYRSAYNAIIAHNPKYNEVLVDEIEKWYNQGKTTLVLVDRIAHGAALGQKLGGRNIEYKFLNGSQEGDYRKGALNQFRSGRLPVIISTCVLDEGVDVPRLEVLILAAGGKSSIRLLQRVGRALRRKTGIGENVATIVDFQHIGSSYFENHFKRRLKIYKSEQFDVEFEDAYDLKD